MSEGNQRQSSKQRLRAALRSLLAVIAGLALALLLIVGVELFSNAVYPIPPGPEPDIPGHVSRYPTWILVVVVLAWCAIGFLATWVSTRIANAAAGGVIGIVLFAALVFNISMLPYALWFKFAMILLFPVSCWLALKAAR